MKRRHLLSLLVSLPLLLTSCDGFSHVHNWSPYFDNHDGTHYRMCLDDSRHIESGKHNFVEEVIEEAGNDSPGIILKKCKDCGYEEKVNVSPLGNHVYDQEVVSQKYLKEKTSDYSSIYYKSSLDGAYGDNSKLFEKSLLPEGYSNIEYLQGSGTEFIDTGVEVTENTSISYNDCKRGNGRLPYGYQEVEYIEFTGTQAIDTKITGNAVWNFDLNWTETTERQLMGYAGSGSEYFGVREGVYAIYTASKYPIGNRDKIKFDFETQSHGFYVNDSLVAYNDVSINVSDKTFLVGCLHYNFFCQFKLYSLSVTKKGNIVANFVPCYNTETKEIGLFDLITCQFFGNTGTGVFLKGNDINSGSRLPAQYQEVEYLEGTGTQYIDTGISAVGGMATKYGAEWTAYGAYLVGSHGESPDYNRNVIDLYSDNTWEFGYGDLYPRVGEANLNTYYEIEQSTTLDNAYLKVDGELLYTGSGQDLTADLNVWLFGNQYSKNLTGGVCPGRLYYVKLYQDDILVRDFVPCYNKQNGEAGMFDLVNSTFFGNDGTGEFLVGRNVFSGDRLPAEYQEVEYLEGTGTQQIDTGIKFDILNYTVDLSFQSSIIEQPGMIFASKTSENYLYFYNYPKSANGCGMFDIYTQTDSVQNYFHGPELDLNVHHLSLSKGAFHLDDNYYGSETRNIVTDENIYLFSFGDRYFFSGKIFSCKITDNLSNTLLEYIPCYRRADKEPGFYDLATNQFIANSGTGKFEVGPDVFKTSELPLNFTRLDYIEGTGTQFIDTGYTINKDDNVILSLDYAANNKDNLWCGANWYLQFSNNYLNDLDRHIYRIENVHGFETIKCDGSTLTTNDFTSEDKSNIKVGLFKLGNDNNTWHSRYQPLSGKLYEATLELDDVIILDLVPCIENNTGEVGLFDLIHQRFLNNCGEGKFVAGYKNNKTITRGDSAKENVKVGYRYIGEEPTYFYGRIYDATIYDGNRVVQKLIPALRNCDSAIGMYDLISGQFFEQTCEFKNGGAVGHHLDKGVVTKKPTLDEEGELTYTCSICGAQIHKAIPRLAYKVNFTFDDGIKEIRIHYNNDPLNYIVSNTAYTRNPFSFNYSTTNASVWFEVICNEGYELDKVNCSLNTCIHFTNNELEYLLNITEDMEVNITSRLIENE